MAQNGDFRTALPQLQISFSRSCRSVAALMSASVTCPMPAVSMALLGSYGETAPVSNIACVCPEPVLANDPFTP